MAYDDDDDFEVPAVTGNTADSLIDARKLRGDSHHVTVHADDLEHLNETQRSDFQQKVSDCNLYQENINKCFPQATTIDSVLRLVAAGIGMHRHRSQVMREFMPVKPPESQKPEVEYDNMGNIVVKKAT